MKKKLIICSDGTWNEASQKKNGKLCPSNVYKILQSVSSSSALGVLQIKFYDDGIGARDAFITRWIRGFTGWGITANIEDCYRFIMNNYEPGDELFFFGFSRGAYTVRSTVGLIRKCGILKREFSNKYGDAFSLYRSKFLPTSDEAKAFRDKYSYTTKINFMGVWDTVGALGIPIAFFKWINYFLNIGFHDLKLSSSVENACQALAIDERRRPFKPAVWEIQEHSVNQTVEQVWFPGVHSDIGGGYSESGLSDITFDWMRKNAEKCGLTFDEKVIKALNMKPDIFESKHNSLNIFYRIFFLFRWRKIPYEVKSNEKLSNEAKEKYKYDDSYKPSNLKEYFKKNEN